MGTWGHEFDANDDASDWLGAFGDDPTWAACEEALALPAGYIEADVCSSAIAAAEVVAAGLGRPNVRLAPELATWAIDNGDGAIGLKRAAATAVASVDQASELQELWDEGDGAEWHATLDDLKTRLN